MIVPDRLQAGDMVRVVTPARCLAKLSDENRALACARFAAMGLKVTFGAHTGMCDLMGSSPVDARVADLHDAFADPDVKAIVCAFGGFNSNQLLPFLDYDLIRANPKILCGFSDITVLINAIFAKTGLVTYHGPNFASFAMRDGHDYTQDYFEKALMQAAPFSALPSPDWSDDPWYQDQDARTFIPNDGYWTLQGGEAGGVALGGSLCSIQLLHGTPYMPDLRGAVVFAEMDAYTDGGDAVEFDRDLTSLTQQPGFDQVQALVIGRFQIKSCMTRETLAFIVDSNKELRRMPVLANVDFGHTSPMLTFPIGSQVRVTAQEGAAPRLLFG